jgi:hypothetical protein
MNPDRPPQSNTASWFALDWNVLSVFSMVRFRRISLIGNGNYWRRPVFRCCAAMRLLSRNSGHSGDSIRMDKSAE